MDDLSADLRPIVDAARAPRLTRSEKTRMWQRIEGALDETPASTPKPGRRFMGPWLVLAALPLAGILGFVVGQQDQETLAANQPTVSAPVERAVAPQVAPTPARVAPSLPDAPEGETRERAASIRSTARKAPRAKTTATVVAAVTAPQQAREADHRAAAPMANSHDRTTRHHTIVSVTRASDEHTEPFDSAVAPAEEPAVPVRRVASAGPAGRAAAFQAKLEEESRARYQAALAQHARSSSIRRPLSSVAGYAAW